MLPKSVWNWPQRCCSRDAFYSLPWPQPQGNRNPLAIPTFEFSLPYDAQQDTGSSRGMRIVRFACADLSRQQLYPCSQHETFSRPVHCLSWDRPLLLGLVGRVDKSEAEIKGLTSLTFFRPRENLVIWVGGVWVNGRMIKDYRWSVMGFSPSSANTQMQYACADACAHMQGQYTRPKAPGVVHGI